MKFLALLCLALFSSTSWATIDINFHGEVVSEPCEVDINSDGQSVDFGVTAIKTFYLAGRSDSKPFSIGLKNCDVSISKTVLVSFIGAEDGDQKGYLSLKSAQVKGLAIGIESISGDVQNPSTLIPLNTGSAKYSLTQGANSFKFAAFLQASPKSIADHSITEGDFNTTVEFHLEYL